VPPNVCPHCQFLSDKAAPVQGEEKIPVRQLTSCRFRGGPRRIFWPSPPHITFWPDQELPCGRPQGRSRGGPDNGVIQTGV